MQQALIYLVEGVFQQVVLGSTAALGGVRGALATHNRGRGKKTSEGAREVVEIIFIFLKYFFLQASCPVLCCIAVNANPSIFDH